MKLSVLDFGYFMPPSVQAVDTINFTFEFVKTLEQLGYHRYWMAEHYNDHCSWTNPEILLALLAGNTDRIKVGAAGIAIYYHNPYRVATAFKMLAALFPGRLDLGIARGAIPTQVQALLTGSTQLSEKVVNDSVDELINYFSREFTYFEDPEHIPLPPYGTSLPSCWVLGTSMSSALNSIKLDANFSLSTFHTNSPLSYFQEVVARYKEEYYSQHNASPTFNVAVQCTCIEDPRRLKNYKIESKYEYEPNGRIRIVGGAAHCQDQLAMLFDTLATDEIVVYDHNRNLEERLEAVAILGESLITA